MRYLTIIFCLLFSSMLFGQSENAFFNRSYWKNNPSIDQIEKDIQSGNDISALNVHRFDAVSWAIIEKLDNATIKYLLDKQGNDVNKITHDGRTYIFWAAYKSNLELMHYLLSKGAKTDIIDEHGFSIMNFAAVTGQTEPAIYELCIKQGTDILTEKNNDDASPLLLLMPHLTSPDFISYFTDRGLSISDIDSKGNNAFVYAAQLGNIVIMNYLINQGLNPNTNNDFAIIRASQGGRNKVNGLQVYEFLKNSGVSPLAVSKDGQNALHSIAKSSTETEVIDFFLENKVDINAADKKGRTPLINAVNSNDLKIVKYLLGKGANQKLLMQNGNSILHVAIERGDEEIIDYVCSIIDNLNLKNNDGLSPLHIAAMKSTDDSIIKLLLLKGADKSLVTEFNETAFDLASENELLQAANINLNFLK